MADRRPVSRRTFIQRGIAGGGVLIVLPLLSACAQQAPAQPTAAPKAAAPAKAAEPPKPADVAKAVPPTPVPTVVAKPTAAAAPTAQAAAQPTPAPAAKVAVKRGGQINTGGPFNYLGMDPHLRGDTIEGTMFLYDNLFRYALDASGQRFEIRPHVAESWEWQEGGKVLMLKIRSGVRFHDNSPLDAAAVAWNLERMAKHPKSVMRGVLEAVDKAEATGSDTVRLSLKRPSVPILVSLSTAEPRSGLVSKAAVDKLGDEGFDKGAVGSGPMRLVDWKPDDRLVLQATGDHWENGADGKPLPYVERGTFRYIPDPAVALLELRSGGVDYTRDIAPKEVATIKGNAELVYDEVSWGGQLYFKFGFNAVKGAFANNVKLRQAAHLALNREAMARTMGFGLAKPHPWPYWGPGMLGFDPTMPAYNYDLDRAKALVAEAGHPNGVDITLVGIAREPERTIAELVKPMWDAVGLRTKVDMIERTAFFEKVKTHDDHDVLFWRGIIWADPDVMLRQTRTGAPDNWTGWSNPDWDKAMGAAAEEPDPTKRNQMYRQAYEIIYRDAIIGVGYQVPGNNAYRKGLEGIATDWSTRNLRYVWWDK